MHSKIQQSIRKNEKKNKLYSNTSGIEWDASTVSREWNVLTPQRSMPEHGARGTVTATLTGRKLSKEDVYAHTFSQGQTHTQIEMERDKVRQKS